MSFEKKTNLGNKYIANRWRLINRSVDMFFTNRSYNLNKNESSISAYTTSYKKEGQKYENNFNFQLKIDLPETTKNLKLVIEKDQDEVKKAISDENLETGSGKTKSATGSKNQSYMAGLTYFFDHSEYFNSALKFGLRIDMPLNPSTKLNLNKLFKYQYVSLELAQDFILYRQEGFSEITSANLSRAWAKTLRTDFVNTLAWTDAADIFVLRNNFLIYKEIGDEKLLSYSIGANAKLSPAFYYESYDTSLSYRQLTYGDWLYGALTVGAEFPKKKNFRMEKFIQLRLEVNFN